MSEEANHLGVGGGADQGHVAVPEGAIDLQVEAGLAGGVPVLSEGLHSVSGEVKVEAVSTDLRCGNLQLKEVDRISPDVIKHTRPSNEIRVMLDIIM